jgi:cellulose synthase/poly-beta-1,6-N-acetylglucosamine synthase-like glycosyltransferase
MLPQPFEVVVLDVDAIQKDIALLHIVEAFNEPNNGALSTATLTHQCHSLASGDGEVEVAEEREQE